MLAGHTIVIEEFLSGEEASFIVIAAHDQVMPLATSQDHKRRDDADRGPNTGGMGAYSPAPLVTPEIHERIMREVIEPTLRGLILDGTPYTGFLYAGLMIAEDGTPNVIEFNCRLGDPETQPILMRLQSDLVDALRSGSRPIARRHARPRWDPRAALGVVMAAGGYPESYRSGDEISGLDRPQPACRARFSMPGRAGRAAKIVTAGGRVLCAVGLGTDRRGCAARGLSTWSRRSTGIWCSIGATSAIARWLASARRAN